MKHRNGEAIRLLVGACCLLMALVTQASAADVDSARKFLQDVYSRYSNDSKGPSTLGRDAPDLFAPDLLALIREDQRISQGEIGLLDHDPICSCQDWNALRVHTIHATRLRSGRVKARVSFENGGHAVHVGFLLEMRAGNWRILDIEESHIPSLRGFLKTGLAKASASPKR